MTSNANSESGVILINVLSVLALASAVMVAILTLQDVSIDRTTRFIDAAAANSVMLGGEASAVTALRRDAMGSVDVDHYGEAWGAIQDANAQIEGGAFKLSIVDEQARFNLNNLLTDGPSSEDILRSLLRSFDAPAGFASRISAFVKAQDGLDDLQQLVGAGVDQALISRLAEVACVLPASTEININTAGEAVLSAVIGNSVAARLLVSRRDRQGFLTPDDLARARILLPPRTGFRSDYFLVATTVTYGTVSQAMISHLHRKRDDDGVRVAVWSRERTSADRFPVPSLSLGE